MNEMIERVAIALQDDFKSVIEETSGKPFSETGVSLPPMKIYRRQARAALKEIRIPTAAMMAAMNEDIDWDADAVRAYVAGINAALEEQQ